jgi:hypothetical protein
MPDAGWILLVIGVYCLVMAKLAKPPKDYTQWRAPTPKPETQRQREYEERWGKYLAEVAKEREEEQGLSMTMFASKADYEAYLALRSSAKGSSNAPVVH